MNAHEKLLSIQESLSFLLPEVILSFGIILLLLSISLKKLSSRPQSFIAIICLLATIFCEMNLFGRSERVFLNQLSIDNYGTALKILLSIAGVLSCFIAMGNDKLRERAAEFHTLLFAAILGGNFLVMSTNMLMIFLSLEIISISSYMLAAFSFNKSGSEGSLKYFLFGSVASAVMLYGMSLFYGYTGTLDLLDPEFLTVLTSLQTWVLMLITCMVMAGFLFKLSAVPFHLWAPDAYQGAPAYVVAFLSTVPKLAGLGIFGRFVLVAGGFGASKFDAGLLISALAVITITVGNVGALMQQNAKRMMAWSSIAQAGFLMIGLGVLTPGSINSMVFYAAVYVVMNMLVFVYLEWYERHGITDIQEFSGLGKTHTTAMVFIAVALIALTGLPPTAGFTAKLLVFSSAFMGYEQGGRDSIMLTVLIIGLLNSVIALFYYLKIPYYAFLKDVRTSDVTKWHSVLNKRQNFRLPENLLGLFLVLVILVLFFIPGLLMGWIIKINFAF